MNHREIHIQLSAYIDNELTDAERSAVDAHLQSCPECRLRAAQMATLKRTVHNAGDIELPLSFASSVSQLIHRDEEVEVTWLGIERYAQRFVLGLAVLVIILVGFTSLRQTEELLPVERYVTGLTSDSAASQILTKRGTVTRDDVLFAVFER